MSDLPEDPFEVLTFDDACTALGVSILDLFAENANVTEVTVRRDGEGGWYIKDNLE